MLPIKVSAFFYLVNSGNVKQVTGIGLNQVTNGQLDRGETMQEISKKPDHAIYMLGPTTCQYCATKLFDLETDNFCCLDGMIVLPEIQVPAELKLLFSYQTILRRHLRRLIRSYNHIFTFTSKGVTVVGELASGRDDIYTF